MRSVLRNLPPLPTMHATELRISSPVPPLELHTTWFARQLNAQYRRDFSFLDWDSMRFPPSSVAMLVGQLESGLAGSFDPLDWLELVRELPAWESGVPSKRRIHVGELVWDAASLSPLAQRILTVFACHHYLGDQKATALRLADALHRTVSRTDSWNNEVGTTLASLGGSSDAIGKLLQLCRELWESPSQFGKRVLGTGFPQETTHRVLAKIGVLVKRDHKLLGAEMSAWIVRCLDDAGRSAQAGLVSSVMEALPETARSASHVRPLAEWIRRHALPGSKDTIWEALTKRAQESLRGWIGDVTYRDFERLIKAMIDPAEPLVNTLEANEPNQLSMRAGFWKNYSQRFERMRVFLPKKTYDRAVASKLLERSSSDVSLLRSVDPREDVEVVVFSTERLIIIEFLRGRSEVRVLYSTPRLVALLFDSQEIKFTVDHFRTIRDFDAVPPHDNMYLWQHDLAQALERLNLLPHRGRAAPFYRKVVDAKPWANSPLAVPLRADAIAERKKAVRDWRGVAHLESVAQSRVDATWTQALALLQPNAE